MPDPSAAPVPSPSSPVRIILVDDDPLTRAAIKPLLRPREDYAVVAEAGDGRQRLSGRHDHRALLQRGRGYADAEQHGDGAQGPQREDCR